MNSLTSADTLDVAGVRKDGGLDLVITAQGPIDSDPNTLTTLERKIRNYIAAATSETFLRGYGLSLDAPVHIFISCRFEIAPAAMELINGLKEEAADQSISINIRKQMGTEH